jgi:hypothetical protein
VREGQFFACRCFFSVPGYFFHAGQMVSFFRGGVADCREIRNNGTPEDLNKKKEEELRNEVFEVAYLFGCCCIYNVLAGRRQG